jgi:hypothetical protein
MFLKNLNQHRKGTGVSVNGHIYFIGPNLIIIDKVTGKMVPIPEKDARELLGGKSWEIYDPAKPNIPGKLKAIERPRISLVTSKGVIPPLPVETPILMEAVVTDVKPLEAPEITAEDESEVTEEPEVTNEPTAVIDPPIPEKGGEWSDPSPEFSTSWLVACAKAYKIKLNKGKPNKGELVVKIKKAMYPEG